jgi:hypothetical protein
MFDFTDSGHAKSPELTQSTGKKSLGLYGIKNMLQTIQRHPGLDQDRGDTGARQGQDGSVKEMAQVDKEENLITSFQTLLLKNGADIPREMIQVPETAAARSRQPKGGMVFLRLNLLVDECGRIHASFPWRFA